jgi:putative transposase
MGRTLHEVLRIREARDHRAGRAIDLVGRPNPGIDWIPRSTFYDWYGRYQGGGIEALEDGKPRPQRVWNKIPDEIGAAIVNLALDEPDLSPRELAVNFTDTKASFVSEASVYRLLKDHGLIASPRAAIADGTICATIQAAPAANGPIRMRL